MSTMNSHSTPPALSRGRHHHLEHSERSPSRHVYCPPKNEDALRLARDLEISGHVDIPTGHWELGMSACSERSDEYPQSPTNPPHIFPRRLARRSPVCKPQHRQNMG